MNNLKRVRQALFVGFMACVTILFMGCDDGVGDTSELDNYFANHPFVTDPRSGGGDVVTITPSSATVDAVGGRAVFSFNGGTAPFTWDVANSGMGTISGSGNQGVYTAKAIGNNDVICYDRDGHAAIAKITGSSSGSSGAALSVSASSSKLESNGSMAVLTASGGKPPYSWSVALGLLGAFEGDNTGTSVVYVRNGAGDNAVTVTDSVGSKASIVIVQP